MMAGTLCVGGCHDGPLYALKHTNPYFVYKEWKADEALGTTDHQRRKELEQLAFCIERLTPERQQYWIEHLANVMEFDQSAEMRRLAVHAAGGITEGRGREIVEQGLKDEVTKVRMEACKSLARVGDEESLRLLATTAGSEMDIDVKHAAIASLGKFQSKIAVDALRMALSDRNPATQEIVVRSLRGSTGKDYGDDPQVWIAKLEGKTSEEEPQSIRVADKLRQLF
jgi:HEAT repeat protein